jgi:hypothetical protein
MNAAASSGSKKAFCSRSTVSGSRDHAGAVGADRGHGDALADHRAGRAGLGGQPGEAPVGTEHREVGLVEADGIVGRPQLREAAPDLVRVDVVVRDACELHRGPHLRHVRRVGRPEVETARRHDQPLARRLRELRPGAVALARHRDVVLGLVRQPDDPRGAVRRALAVPERAGLEKGHVVAVAGQLVRGRQAHQAAADHDHVH